MAATESTMLPLGTRAPAFTLPDPDGTVHELDGTASATLVMFICNHCPFVKHIRKELATIGRDYGERGVAIFAINSNDFQSYPADAPPLMKKEAEEWDYRFPYLIDEDQSVARAYSAACTPDFFLFDADLALVYRGQLDDSRPGNGIPVSGSDLRAALNALLAGESVTGEQKPSIGCNIKWRS